MSLKDKVIELVIRGRDLFSPEAIKAKQAMDETAKETQALNAQLEALRKTSQQLGKAQELQQYGKTLEQNMAEAKATLAELTAQMAKTPGPSAELKRALSENSKELDTLEIKIKNTDAALSEITRTLVASGINLGNTAEEQRRLRTETAQLNQELTKLKRTQADVSKLDELRTNTVSASKAYAESTKKLQDLAAQMDATKKPTIELKDAHALAKSEATRAATAYQTLDRQLQQHEDRVSKAGIGTKNLGAAEKELADQIAKTQLRLADLTRTQNALTGYDKLTPALEKQQASLKASQVSLEKLRQEYQAAVVPQKAFTQQLGKAAQLAGQAQIAYEKNEAKLAALRTQLQNAGVGTRDLGAAQQTLNQRMAETSASIDKNKKDLRSLNSDMGSTSESSSKLGSSIRNLASHIVVLAGTYIGLDKVRQGLTSIISTGGDFEVLRQQLIGVYGDVAEGEKAFSWAVDLNKKLPTSLDDVLQAFIMLKNNGMDPMDGTLEKMINANVRYGKGAETLIPIIRQLTQSWGKNRIQAEEAYVLIENGLPVWNLLSEATGKATAELQKMSEKGLLTRDYLQKLIDTMGAAGAGVVEQRMTTWNTLMTKFKDSVKQAQDQIANSGALDVLKEQLGGINSQIAEFSKDGTFKSWGESLSKSFDVANGVIQDSVRLFDEWGGTIKTVGTIWLGLQVGSKVSDTIKWANALRVDLGNAGRSAAGSLAQLTARTIAQTTAQNQQAMSYVQRLKEIASSTAKTSGAIDLVTTAQNTFTTSTKRFNDFARPQAALLREITLGNAGISTSSKWAKAGMEAMAVGAGTLGAAIKAIPYVVLLGQIGKTITAYTDMKASQAAAARSAEASATSTEYSKESFRLLSERLGITIRDMDALDDAVEQNKVHFDQATQSWMAGPDPLSQVGIAAELAAKKMEDYNAAVEGAVQATQSAANGKLGEIFSKLGLDLDQASGRVGKTVQSIVDSLDTMRAATDLNAEAIAALLNKAFDSTKNQAEIQAVIDKMTLLHEQGKLVGAPYVESLAQATEAAKKLSKESTDGAAIYIDLLNKQKEAAKEAYAAGKISSEEYQQTVGKLNKELEKTNKQQKDNRKSSDELSQAYNELGLQSSSTLADIAANHKRAFEEIRSSTATVEVQRQAFLAYAEAELKAAQAADRYADGSLYAQAASLGLTNELTALEKTIETTGSTALITAGALDSISDSAKSAAESSAEANKELSEIEQTQQKVSEGAQSAAAHINGYSSALQQMARDMSAQTEQVMGNLMGWSRGTGETSSAVSELNQKLADNYAQWKAVNSVIPLDGIQEYMKDLGLAYLKSEQAWLSQARSAAVMVEKLEDVDKVTLKSVKQAERLYNNLDMLDEQDLSGLRSAIDSARSKMDQLASSATSTLNSLRDELDQYNGALDAIEQRDYETKLTALQAQLATAKAAQDAQVIADTKESMEILKQLHKQKMQDIAEEAAAKRAAAAEEAASTSKSSSSSKKTASATDSPTTTSAANTKEDRAIVEIKLGGKTVEIPTTTAGKSDLLDIVQQLANAQGLSLK